jgi:hypothetical protein
VALTDAEVQRIKFELGYNLISISAEPYVSHLAYFNQILKPYLESGAATTSSTPVTAASSPTPQSLVLSSATGFAAGNVVVVDVDSRQEKATIQNISGSSITVLLSLAHSGTFPVVVEGGESIIREVLRQLTLLTTGMNGQAGTMSSMRSRIGIKRIEGEIEYFGGGSTLASQGIDPLTQIDQLRNFWRDELASALGVPRMNAGSASGGNTISVY